MHSVKIILVGLVMALFATLARAETYEQKFMIPTSGGKVLVEGFGACARDTCPAVLILSGSRGFGAPVYREIGKIFREAGLSPWLVHVLSPADLDAIATARDASARIAFYEKRLPQWLASVQDVAFYLHSRPQSGGKVAILGISLGAQIASAVSADNKDIDALVLVDGGFPNGYSKPVQSLPPLLLIWGKADRTFPLSVGQDMQKMAQRLGGPVTLDVYEGGAHDFFLKSGTANASAAHRNAAHFLTGHLAR